VLCVRRCHLRELLLGLFPRGLVFSPARTADKSRAVWKLSGPAVYKGLSGHTPSGGEASNSNDSRKLSDSAESVLPNLRRDPNAIVPLD